MESLTQLGIDRIIDLQFGSGEAAYHVILELYDRGNVVLTDHEMTILYVLRPHTEGDKVKFAVREKYPQNRAREEEEISKEKILGFFESARTGDQVKKVLVSKLGNYITRKFILLLHSFVIFFRIWAISFGTCFT